MPAIWLVSFLAYFCHTRGAFTQECPTPRLLLFRDVKSGGFHREIQYSAKLDVSEIFNDCFLWINETIPRSLYVNTDQLDDLARLKKLITVVKDFVNVETPETESDPHHLLVFLPLKDTRQLSNVTLPIHLRYHAAQVSGGFVRRKLEVPRVYLNCSVRPVCSASDFVLLPCDRGECLFQNVSLDLIETGYEIDVPVGNLDHLLFVQLVTILVTICGSLYICKVLFKYRPDILIKK